MFILGMLHVVKDVSKWVFENCYRLIKTNAVFTKVAGGFLRIPREFHGWSISFCRVARKCKLFRDGGGLSVRRGVGWSTDSVTPSHRPAFGAGKYVGAGGLADGNGWRSLRGGGGCPCGEVVVNELCHPAQKQRGRRTRGQGAIETFMREYEAEVWVSDCWKAQLNAPAKTPQICLAHQIRNLQGLIEKRPRLQWAQDMQALSRKAIHLGKRRTQLTKEGFAKQAVILEKRLKQLLQRTFRGLGANLLKRYRKHRDALLVFLHHVDVPAHNNACERALRPSVIHRKVMGSSRSDWGAQGYAALATVLNTAKRHGQSTFQKLVALMGQPVLPFIEASA